MRTGTGVVHTVFDNGLVKLRTNRNNLYTPCSGMMCENNALIDAKNPIGAIKGQYVKFNIPDGKMGVGGAVCFGGPLLLVLVLGMCGYWLGGRQGVSPELAAFGGMILGGLLGAFLLKLYEKKIGKANTMAEITDILVEETIEMESWQGSSGKNAEEGA